MKTNIITKTLRKSELPEAKVLTRYANGKAETWQKGWKLWKYEDHVVVNNTAIQFYFDLEASQQFANRVYELITAAGLQVEIITGSRKHTFTGAITIFITEIRITEAGK
jgi:hypothetical protein